MSAEIDQVALSNLENYFMKYLFNTKITMNIFPGNWDLNIFFYFRKIFKYGTSLFLR